MKRWGVSSLVVIMFFSYVFPVEAMLTRTPEELKKRAVRLKELKERKPLTLEEKEEKRVEQLKARAQLQQAYKKQEAAAERLAQPAQPEQQPGFMSRAWSSVSNVFSLGKQAASLTQQQISNTFSKVKNWSWNEAFVVLTAIALAFGFVIAIYKTDGQLVDTVGDKSFFGSIILSAAYMGGNYIWADFNQTTARLIQQSEAMTQDPQVAIDGLKRAYEKEIQHTQKDKMLTKASYDAAINYFKELLQLQKNMALAAAEKSTSELKRQEAFLVGEKPRKEVFRAEKYGIKAALGQAKQEVSEKLKAEAKIGDAKRWLADTYKDPREQIAYLDRLITTKRQVITYPAFPIDVEKFPQIIIRIRQQLVDDLLANEMDETVDEILAWTQTEAPDNLQEQIKILSKLKEPKRFKALAHLSGRSKDLQGAVILAYHKAQTLLVEKIIKWVKGKIPENPEGQENLLFMIALQKAKPYDFPMNVITLEDALLIQMAVEKLKSQQELLQELV